MSEAAANSKEKNEIEVSKTILPENKKYESESLNYQIKIPDWLLKDINNFEKSNKQNNDNQNLIVKAFKLAYKAHDGQFVQVASHILSTQLLSQIFSKK